MPGIVTSSLGMEEITRNKMYAIEIIKQPLYTLFEAPIASKNGQKVIGNKTLAEIAALIKGDQYRIATQHMRTLSPEGRKEFKRLHLDYFTPSGIFREVRDEALIMHSGRICIDLDHLDNDEQQRRLEIKDWLIHNEDFITELLWTSPSGKGLKWIVDMSHEFAGAYGHRAICTAVLNYLRKELDLTDTQCDYNCINVSRAPFLCWDPDAYINPRYVL